MPKLTAAAILLVPLVLLFAPLTGTRTLAAFDHLMYLYPHFTFAREAFQSLGTLPMWTPHLFGGMPFVESLGPGLLYPTDLLCWWLGVSPERTFALDAFIHLAIAAWGTRGLLVARGLAPGPAITGALIYMLAGTVAGHLAYGTHAVLRSAAWLPWLFLAIELSFAGRRREGLLIMAVTASLMSLALGYQILAYAVPVLPLYVLLSRRARSRGKTCAVIGLALVLAAVLSAVTLVPCARYHAHSLRATGQHFWPGAGALPVVELPLLVSPLSWTGGPEPLLPGQPDAPRQAKYLGLLAAGLALAGFSFKKSSRAWCIVALGGLVLALGLATPAGRLVASLPPFNAMRTPAHWLTFTQLALAVLAAEGLARMARDPLVFLRRLVLAMLFAFACFLIISRISPDQAAVFGRTALIALALAFAAAASSIRSFPPRILLAAASVLAVLDLGLVARSRLVTVRPAEIAAFEAADPIPKLLRAIPRPFRVHTEESQLLCNLRIPSGLEWIPGYHSVPLALFARFFDSSMACRDPALPLGWLATRFIVAPDPNRYPSALPRKSFLGLDGRPYVLCENPAALPSAFFADRLEDVPTDEDIVPGLCSAPPGSKIIFSTPQSGLRAPGGLSPGRILDLKRTPNEISADIVADGEGIVVFSELFYPAWSAYVNGVRSPLLRVNLALRGVPVSEGLHNIAMSFESLPFKIGLLLSSTSWIALGLLLLLSHFQAGRAAASSIPE